MGQSFAVGSLTEIKLTIVMLSHEKIVVAYRHMEDLT